METNEVTRQLENLSDAAALLAKHLQRWDESHAAQIYSRYRQLIEGAFPEASGPRVRDTILAMVRLLRDGGGERVALRAYTVADLLALDVPPRDWLLEPILRERDLALLHAWRGTGKTYFALGVALAVASGGRFLAWQAPRPRRVLYLDGEMPLAALQERLAALVRSPEVPEFPAENLRFLCADATDEGIPSLATRDGQEAIAPLVEDVDLVVVDSISTLASHGRENEAESWLPLQTWSLALRRRGKSVVYLHHESKGGLQRGTSRREDVLDLVVRLARPADYEAVQGARFELHFTKARSLRGEAVLPLDVRLDVNADGVASWTWRPADDARLRLAAELYRNGATPRDVMAELRVSQATAYRLREKAREMGLLETDDENEFSRSHV